MGSLYVIGIGNGNYDDLTLKAINILNEVEFIYCDEKIYNNFINFFCKDKIIENKYNETSSRCNSAIQCALQGKKVAILGSGDTGIYGIASIILERSCLYNQIRVEIIPGITSFCAAADKAQISLCEGNESVAIIPSLKSNLLEKYIADFDTVVIMKSGNDTDVIYDILKKYGLENNAIVSSCIGMENEIIEKIQKGKSYGYFTTVIVRK